VKALRIDLVGVVFVLVWSSGYVVGALATQQIAPLAVTLWRFLVAAVVLTLIAVRRRERFPRGRELWQLAGLGIPMFALQFGALYQALAEGLPAGTTALIACSSPLAVAAVSAVARWERLTLVQWAGVALGVVGVAVTLSDRVGRPPSVATLLWALLGLAGLVCGTVLQGRVRVTTGPAAAAATQIGAAVVVLAVWAPLRGPVAMPLTGHAVGSFAWLALVAGVGAPLLFFALIRQRGATRASSLLFPVPAVTAIASWPILGTPIGAGTVGGIVIVAGALWLLRRRPEPAAAVEPVRDRVAA
jgi:drug/metabolite transporter (DMT)-like permease